MDRLISEQAVLDAIKEWASYMFTTPTGDLLKMIKAIPSAESCESCCNGNQEEKAMLCQKSYLAGMEHRDKWIPVSEKLPEEDGDYFVTYEKGYAEDYDLTPIGIARFEVDCESFGYWYEHFDRQTLGSLGSEWEEIKVIAWMPLPEPYKPQESEE